MKLRTQGFKQFEIIVKEKNNLIRKNKFHNFFPLCNFVSVKKLSPIKRKSVKLLQLTHLKTKQGRLEFTNCKIVVFLHKYQTMEPVFFWFIIRELGASLLFYGSLFGGSFIVIIAFFLLLSKNNFSGLVTPSMGIIQLCLLIRHSN